VDANSDCLSDFAGGHHQWTLIRIASPASPTPSFKATTPNITPQNGGLRPSCNSNTPQMSITRHHISQNLKICIEREAQIYTYQNLEEYIIKWLKGIQRQILVAVHGF